LQLAQWQLVVLDDDAVAALRERLSVEETQLLYQIAIQGRRDIGLAPNPRAGFEMTLLRMLAFRPAADGGEASQGAGGGAKAVSPASPGRLAATVPTPNAVAMPVRHADVASVRQQDVAPVTTPSARPMAPSPSGAAVAAVGQAASVPAATHAPAHAALDLDRWADLLAALDLRGPIRELAYNAVPLGWADGRLRLGLSAQHELLRTEGSTRQLAEALAGPLGAVPRLAFEVVQPGGTTLAAQARRQQDERQRDAEAAVAADPVVARLIADFDARVLPGSVRPVRSN
jgi:DNA polymerase-3 subunit gamma/tau